LYFELQAIDKHKKETRDRVMSEHHHWSSKVETIKMQHDEFGLKSKDTTNQLIRATDSEMSKMMTEVRQMMTAKDKEIEQLTAANFTATTKLITVKDKVID
jgi:hypothetical protein